MSGILSLAGGQEFQKGNESLDRYLLQQAGGFAAPVVVVAMDRPDRAAISVKTGQKWLTELGATQVEGLALSGDNLVTGPELAAARLIYLTDGDLNLYLASLANRQLWEVIRQAFGDGAILAASGAGAMILMETVYQPANDGVYAGAGLLPGSILIPHFNNVGRQWATRIGPQLPPDSRLIGLDEKVAMVGQELAWQVYGRGWVTLYQQGQPSKYQGGQPFRFRAPGQ